MLTTVPEFSRLPCGIRVVSFPMLSTETITVLVLVGVGSRDEEEPLGGVSHFLEHLFFKGSKRYPSAREVSHTLDAIGAQYNAFTTKEVTGFYVTAVHSKLELILDVLSDILLQPLLSPAEIERERGVIVEEMKLYQDTPSRHIGDIFERLLWKGSPLGNDIIGTAQTLAAITQEDIKRYFTKHYRAGRTVISVAGKFSEGELNTLLHSRFERFSKGGRSTRPLNGTDVSDSVLLEKKNTDQAHLALGVATFGVSDRRKEALQVLATVLGGGMSSRLFSEVRERLGLAYYVYSSSEHYHDTGALVSHAGVNTANIDKAILAIKKEYEGLCEKLIPDKELVKAKEYIKGQFLLELESSSAVANFVGLRELLLERRESLSEYFARLNAVTAKELRTLASSIFSPDRLRLAVIGPYQNSAKFTKLLS